MTKLLMDQAPKSAVPRLFLLSAGAWGCVAGMLLAMDGSVALVSRWSGSTLALVHAFTLGLLGNAMFGSMLQFLPVATHVRVRGGARAALLMYFLLNIGALLLVVGFRWPQGVPLWLGGTALLVAFVLLAVLVLPELRMADGQRLLRWEMGAAVVGAVVAALLGLVLVFARVGGGVVSAQALTDVHAGWGVLGWVLALLAAVARVVVPMFQGVSSPPARWQVLWQSVLYAVLLTALIASLRGQTASWYRIGVAITLLALALALAWLLQQLRAPKRRKSPLVAFWIAGFCAIASAALVLLFGGSHPLMVGALVIAIGLPLLVTGMQLEIISFLGWIDLQRRCGRGVHLPGVQLLVPVRDKYVVLALQLSAAGVLLLALQHPALAQTAGLVLLCTYCAIFTVLCGPTWRGRRFIAQLALRNHTTNPA